jgi:NAD(P) transhydrogenase
MLCDADVDIFVESTFNFLTLAEAYRIAALAILVKRPE